LAIDDDNSRWLKPVLEEARRVGLRLDRPADILELARHLQRYIAAQAAARARPDPDGLEPWQRHVVAELLVGFIGPAVSRLTRPPRSALLITLFGEDGGLGEIAVDERVEVEVTLKGDKTRTLQPTAVVEAGGRMRGVVQVETVGPSLGYILWVGRWPSECMLLAWDLRGVLLNVPDKQLDNLLARLRGVAAGHPRQSPGWHAREEREATLRRMDGDEQRMVLRQALEDELMDPESRRIPVRGIIRAGTTAIWDAGGTGSPYGLLQKLSALLRTEREWQERETDEGLASEPAAEQPEYETLIRDHTEGLVGSERVAVQHYLRARLIDGLDFKTYCANMRIRYEATRKAAKRGLDRLRTEK
jgi:hypothetical protein